MVGFKRGFVIVIILSNVGPEVNVSDRDLPKASNLLGWFYNNKNVKTSCKMLVNFVQA